MRFFSDLFLLAFIVILICLIVVQFGNLGFDSAQDVLRFIGGLFTQLGDWLNFSSEVK